ncbi:hypothetical protein [Streptomyces sp. NPDC091259]|uniref:hypothetical protein n=1 Tax=Streptomyces sp. NPDC091259 TaxID=3365976 RepID=UPI0037F4D17C
MGRFSAADSCYWKPTDGPAGGLPAGFNTGAPDGWKPGDPGGSLYLVTCPTGGGDVRAGIRWSPTGPADGGVDVQALAHQAVEPLRLEGSDIGIVPFPTGRGVVGMPVWMWNQTQPAPHSSGQEPGRTRRRNPPVLHRRQRQPHIVTGYFRAPHVRYILDT